MSYLSSPTFDTISDNPSYEDAVKNPVLYEDCYAVWSGRVSNAVTQGTSYRFDLLVGYCQFLPTETNQSNSLFGQLDQLVHIWAFMFDDTNDFFEASHGLCISLILTHNNGKNKDLQKKP